MLDESLDRAMRRTVAASRCLDGAAQDVRAFQLDGGLAGGEAAQALQYAAMRVEEIAQAIEELRD